MSDVSLDRSGNLDDPDGWANTRSSSAVYAERLKWRSSSAATRSAIGTARLERRLFGVVQRPGEFVSVAAPERGGEEYPTVDGRLLGRELLAASNQAALRAELTRDLRVR